MINKKSIWFLTLFSLILVLSVYYITMPSELLLNTNGNYTEEDDEAVSTTIEESTILVSLRVEKEEELLQEMENLRLILTNDTSSIEDKNKAFEKMKGLNKNKGEEEALESKIKDTYNINSFVRIKDDQIEVVLSSQDKSTKLANQIMRTIQENYETQKYITVKFTN